MCLINHVLGTKFCCVDLLHKGSIEYLDTQRLTGNETCSDCCNDVISRFGVSDWGNRTLYYRNGGDVMDPSNPKCDMEFSSGCNINFVSESAVCRLVP